MPLLYVISLNVSFNLSYQIVLLYQTNRFICGFRGFYKL